MCLVCVLVIHNAMDLMTVVHICFVKSQQVIIWLDKSIVKFLLPSVIPQYWRSQESYNLFSRCWGLLPSLPSTFFFFRFFFSLGICWPALPATANQMMNNWPFDLAHPPSWQAWQNKRLPWPPRGPWVPRSWWGVCRSSWCVCDWWPADDSPV